MQGQQPSNPSIVPVSSVPSGNCSSSLPLLIKTPDGVLYACQSGVWATVPGGSGSAGGTTGQSQVNSSGILAGQAGMFSLSGFGAKGDAQDLFACSVTATSQTLTCTDASFTSADSGKTFLVDMGTGQVATALYQSGATVTGSQGKTCAVTLSGGSTNATGTVILTGTNTIATGTPITIIPNFGSGFTSAPTTATFSNGTATCSGTATVTSKIQYAPVVTTATYASATSMTMATAATSTATGVFATYGTNNDTAVSNWLTACEASQGFSCYVPPGQFLVTQTFTIPSAINIYGSGANAIWGPPGSGFSASEPSLDPYVGGSVFVEANPNTTLFNITACGVSDNLYNFGFRFAPPISFLETGDGIDATCSQSSGGFPGYGQMSAFWQNLIGWGGDGDHLGYYLTNISAMLIANVQNIGGGFMHIVSNTNICCTGNTDITQVIGSEIAGGTQSDFSMTGGNSNLYNIKRLNMGVTNARGLISSWPIPPPNATQEPYYSDGQTVAVIMIAPDLETTAGATSYGYTATEDVEYGLRDGSHQPVPMQTWNSLMTQLNNGNFAIGCGRSSPCMLEFGSGTWESVGSLPIVSGCSFTGLQGGASAGQFTAGATSCSVTLTTVGTATHGVICHLTDLTTPSDTLTQSSSSTTQCAVSGTVVSGDVIQYRITGY